MVTPNHRPLQLERRSATHSEDLDTHVLLGVTNLQLRAFWLLSAIVPRFTRTFFLGIMYADDVEYCFK